MPDTVFSGTTVLGHLDFYQIEKILIIKVIKQMETQIIKCNLKLPKNFKYKVISIALWKFLFDYVENILTKHMKGRQYISYYPDEFHRTTIGFHDQ